MKNVLIATGFAVVLLLQLLIFIQLQGQIWMLEDENMLIFNSLDLIFKNLGGLDEVESHLEIIKQFRGEGLD